MSATNDLPKKTRELQNHHMDSTVWNDFEFRDDDIFIGTFAKAGTTWMQQIVGQLVYNGDPSICAQDFSPWLELRVMPQEEIGAMLKGLETRRFIKTHLPLDALVFHSQAKYVYVTRDFPDIVWSLHNHLYNAMDVFYEMINDTPGRVGPALERPPEDPVEFWRMMLSGEYEVWSFWENVKTWWDYRHLSNIKLVHFNNLKNDLAGQISELAKFLNIRAEKSTLEAATEHSSFEWMKANADLVTPMAGDIFEGGAQTFINKGTNKRWKDLLTDADYQEYVAIAEQKLGSECAQWVRTGELN